MTNVSIEGTEAEPRTLNVNTSALRLKEATRVHGGLIKMKKFILLSAIISTFTAASVMQAATIQLSVQEGAFNPLTQSSNGGFVYITPNTTYHDFKIEDLTGSGSPLSLVPYLDLSTFDVTTSLTSATTLTLKLTETGLTLPTSPLPITSAFVGILNGVTSETISSYYDNSNTAFGTGQLLGTTTFTAAGSNSSNKFGTITAAGTFSETEIIVATFGATAGSTESLNSSALISAAPEPLSLGVAGIGLLAVGVIGARRRKKA